MAEGREIAAAYIALVPSARGIKSNLEKELRGPAQQAGQTAGRAIEDGITSGTESAGKKAASLLATTLGSAAVLRGLNKAKDAASELQQAVGGTEAVFGDASAAIDTFAERSAESVGLSARAARTFTSQIGAALQGYGYAVDEAADKSIELTSLGADLAATFGGTVPEAVTALSAALRGEFDPLERYGVALRASDIAARAVKDGLAASESSVSSYAKAQTTLAIILEKTAGAQGQFGRESESAAGQAAISAAKTEDAAADLGESLLPIYAKISETVGTVADVFAALPGPVQTGIVALAGIVAVAGPISRTVDLIRTIRPAATDAAKALSTTAVTAQNSAGSVSTLYANTGRASGAMRGLATAGGILAAAGIGATLYGIAKAGREVRVDLPAALQATTDELISTAAGIKGLRGDSGLEDFLRPLIESGDAGVAAVKEMRDELAATGEDVSVFDEALAGAAEGQNLLNERTTAGAGALKEFGLEAPPASSALNDLAGESETTAEKLGRLHDELSEGVDLFRGYFDAATSDDEALISFRDGLRDIADMEARVADGSLKGQERIDEFTTRILAGRDSILDYATALVESGSPLDDVKQRVQEMTTELFAQADQAGLTKDEVNFLRESLDLMPEDIDVAIETNLRDVTEDLKKTNEQIYIAAVRLNEIRDRFNDVRQERLLGLDARAHGGPMVPGRSYLVGEEGIPEIVTVGANSFVTPKDMFESAGMPPTGGSAPLLGSLTVLQMPGEDSVITAMRELRRTQLLVS